MNFKIGDRVYFKAVYPSIINSVSGLGEIGDENMENYYIIPDVPGLVGSTYVVVDKNDNNELCIPEKVYNSKLYKALK